MFLELDDIIFSLQKFGGISTYWAEIGERLDRIFSGNISHIAPRKWERLVSPYSKAKVFHSSHFRVSSNPLVQNVTTIHDLIFEKGLFSDISKIRTIINLYERKKSLSKADAIICISYSTKKDLIDYYGALVRNKPIYVIHHGCSFSNDQKIDISDSYLPVLPFVSKCKYFLYVGGRLKYKNFNFVLEALAYGKFPEKGIKLICTGIKFNEAEILLINKLGLSEHVFSVGMVDESTLGYLYSHARALVYPSTYEGFGLPALEAMASSCPVISSNTSSLPEVVSDAAVLVNPFNINEMIAAMRALLNNDTYNHYVNSGLDRSKEFSWDKSAQKHASVYKELANI